MNAQLDKIRALNKKINSQSCPKTSKSIKNSLHTFSLLKKGKILISIVTRFVNLKYLIFEWTLMRFLSTFANCYIEIRGYQGHIKI